MEDGLVLRALEILKRASKDLQSIAAGGDESFRSIRYKFDLYYSPPLKALLALQIESRSSGVLSADPELSTLRSLLSQLKDLCLSGEIAAADSRSNLLETRMDNRARSKSGDSERDFLQITQAKIGDRSTSKSVEVVAADSRSNLLEVMPAKIDDCVRSKSGDSESDLLQITQAKINDRSIFKSGEVVAADSRSNWLETIQEEINDRARFESGGIAAADSGGDLPELMQAEINNNRCRSKSGEMDEADSSDNLFEKVQTKIENAASGSGDDQAKLSNCSRSKSREIAAEDSRSNFSQTKIGNRRRSKCSGEIPPADSTGEISLIHRAKINREISLIAQSIESEIQSWIEREILRRLVSSLRSISISTSTSSSDALAWLLRSFQNLLSRGFNRKLQDLVLRSGVLPTVTAVLASPSAPIKIRHLCASAVSSMVKFNRDVFVGHVLIGGSSPVHRSLSTMATPPSLRVLLFLVSSIKTAIVDELHSDGQLPSLVAFLSSPDPAMAESALELLLKVAYYARKEAVDAMIEANVVKRLAILQLSEKGGALIAVEEDRSSSLGGRPFVSCVARFAIQVEVGEGMRRREKIEAKGVILARVKEAVESEADATAIFTEVLWGSSP